MRSEPRSVARGALSRLQTLSVGPVIHGHAIFAPLIPAAGIRGRDDARCASRLRPRRAGAVGTDRTPRRTRAGVVDHREACSLALEGPDSAGGADPAGRPGGHRQVHHRLHAGRLDHDGHDEGPISRPTESPYWSRRPRTAGSTRSCRASWRPVPISTKCSASTS